jgi:hypothetical protein
MHTDKVFYSNAQIKKADWDLAFRNRGEKSAAAPLDKPSGKSAERRTANGHRNGHRVVRPATNRRSLRALSLAGRLTQLLGVSLIPRSTFNVVLEQNFQGKSHVVDVRAA